ncbi:hypothetical protein MMC19_003610 [Ptychographa xylographoides]|nr:hypothetical protein [Ptychographa xylographoides]
MTIELCTASCKSNGFRYAGLEYYFQCFCGDSIYGASADPSNCNLACTGDSTEVCGGNDFVSIYADPTFPALDNTTISDYTGAGCYSEGTAGRAIQFQQTVNKATMTTESCLQQCKNEGYPLAATEYGQECYCGVVIGNGSLPVSSSNCNIPCNGNSNEICGGSSYLNLYVAIDLEEASPCAPTTPATTLPPTTTATSTTTSSTLTTTSSTSTTTTTSATSSATSSTSTTSTTATPTSTTSSTTSTSTFEHYVKHYIEDYHEYPNDYFYDLKHDIVNQHNYDVNKQSYYYYHNHHVNGTNHYDD